MKFVTGLIAFILIITVIFAIGTAMFLHSRTVVDWWLPTAICAVLALVVTIPLGRIMKRATYRIVQYLEYPVAFIVSFSLLICGFYLLNYSMADKSTRAEYGAPVIRKFREERTEVRRVGRRRYKEENHRVYFIEIELKDGSTKKIEKPIKEYNRIKKGNNLIIAEEKGLFGFTVIKDTH